MELALPLAERSMWVKCRGTIGLVILAPFLLAALFSEPYARQGTWADLEFDVAGWILFFVGAGFRLWATLYIGGRKGQALATQGPYSVCRNPLYFGTFLMLLATIIFLQSLTFALGSVVAACVYLSLTVGSEERRLAHKFGIEYQDYRRRVPRFWPRIGLHQSPPLIEVNMRGLGRECKNAARWIWIPILGEVVATLRGWGTLPALLHLP